MHGNVWEWVRDCGSGDHRERPTDGSVYIFEDCPTGVMRGGSWFNLPKQQRSAERNPIGRRLRDDYYGFRVARALPAER